MAQPAAIERLIADLGPLMARHDFSPPSTQSVWTGKFNVFSWERHTWKHDVVRLLWRVGPASACVLDAEWSVNIDGNQRLASGLNAIHARRAINQVDLPKEWLLIGGWLATRWRASLVADAEVALAWCDRTVTRDGAIEDLRREDRNGPRAGSEPYLAIERHVLDHAPQQDAEAFGPPPAGLRSRSS